LKAFGHFAVAAVLTFATYFFTWIWFVSGQVCSDVYGSCTFEPSYANVSFISLGILCGFLACTETVIAFKSRNLGSITSESPRQHKFRIMGIWSMVIGALIAFAGFYDFNNMLVSCPADGCSASALMGIYGPIYAMFYSGMILVALGDLLVMATKFMKIRPIPIQTEKPIQ
jgi:hypothetical protein